MKTNNIRRVTEIFVELAILTNKNFTISTNIKNNDFHEGNKRTAHFLAQQFCYFENKKLNLEYKSAVKVIASIADSSLSFKEIEKWVSQHLVDINIKLSKELILVIDYWEKVFREQRNFSDYLP